MSQRTGERGSVRLTNAFSKKLENFKAAVVLHYAYYNFVKSRIAIRCTPAMAAGVTNAFWTVRDLVEMVGTVSERLERLKAAVETACGCTATHSTSHLLTETFKEHVVWEGVVEAFRLDGHQEAKRCYAFYLMDDEPILQTVLELPPIDSPRSAVRAAIVAKSKQSKSRNPRALG